mmetsp:Transcript_99826/g.280679  ORF Transcript_99826/g.280679 Transcript_99826/m.280679 type:complete len:264 (+) Transcript_99826:85-876(+)
MVRLEHVAAMCSGVSLDRSAKLNDFNLYEGLGHDWFVSLSTNFYERVYSDLSAPWFRQLFLGSAKEDAIRNQYEWLIQRCGGPSLYTERKGHPGLLGNHGSFDVTEAGAERWLLHMELAVAETPMPDTASVAPDKAREVLVDFFRHTAHFIAAGQRMREGKNMLGSAGKSTRARAQDRKAREGQPVGAAAQGGVGDSKQDDRATTSDTGAEALRRAAESNLSPPCSGDVVEPPGPSPVLQGVLLCAAALVAVAVLRGVRAARR